MKGNLPINIQEKDRGLFKTVFGRSPSISKYYFSFLHQNGYVLSFCPIALITRRKVSISDIIWILRNYFFRVKDIQWIGCQVLIPFDELSTEYFHWMLDVLPKIQFSVNKCETIILPKNFDQPIINESISAFPELKTIWFDNESTCFIKKAVVPKMNVPSGNYHAQILRKLRKRFHDKLNIKDSDIEEKRTYVSRGKVNKRRIVNEDELIKALKKYNFKTVYFEDLSFWDQCILSFQSSILLGNHGAGLSNMLFMRPGKKVIEIRRNDDMHNNCFYSLANALDLKYYYFLAPAVSENQDVMPDVHKLELLISEIISN